MSVLTTMAYVPITVSILWEVITVNVLLDMLFNLTIMFVKVGHSFECDIIAIMYVQGSKDKPRTNVNKTYIVTQMCAHI